MLIGYFTIIVIRRTSTHARRYGYSRQFFTPAPISCERTIRLTTARRRVRENTACPTAFSFVSITGTSKSCGNFFSRWHSADGQFLGRNPLASCGMRRLGEAFHQGRARRGVLHFQIQIVHDEPGARFAERRGAVAGRGHDRVIARKLGVFEQAERLISLPRKMDRPLATVGQNHMRGERGFRNRLILRRGRADRKINRPPRRVLPLAKLDPDAGRIGIFFLR